jgi:hypothetical protein
MPIKRIQKNIPHQFGVFSQHMDDSYHGENKHHWTEDLVTSYLQLVSELSSRSQK